MLSKYLRRFLDTSECDFLYNCNHYFSKRFFEFALGSEEYKEKVRNGNTLLYRDRFSVFHCNIIQCACIVSLQDEDVDVDIFKEFYKTYITFKKKSLYFTGKNEWHEFTLTILSHLIWSREYKLFLWVYDHQVKLIDHVINMNIQWVERSRKYWYRKCWMDMHIYLFRFCILSDRLDMCQNLLNSKVFKVNRDTRKIASQIGFEFDRNKQIVSTEFSNTIEWKWMNKYTTSLENVNIVKCIDIFIESGFDKSRIVDLFRLQDPNVFWNYFLNISNTHLKHITSTKICNIIGAPKFVVSSDTMKKKIIHKMFDLSNKITKTLIFYLCDCITGYKIDFIDGFEKTMQLYNDPKNRKKQKLNEIVSKICKLCVKKHNDDKVEKVKVTCPEKIFFLHSCFGEVVNELVDFENDSVSNEGDCAICLNEMTDGCIYLPCRHKFHKSCVQLDFSSRSRTGVYFCPLCRVKVHKSCLK